MPVPTIPDHASGPIEGLQAVRLADIQPDPEIQARVALKKSTVRQYAAAMRRGSKFTPIFLFWDGTRFWLADGYHRWTAAGEAGLTSIEAEVRFGTRRDAILFAAGANAGLPRTNEDKRRAVRMLLADAEWSNRSNEWIADSCGVSHSFVAKLRGPLSTVESRDGRLMCTGAIGQCRGGPDEAERRVQLQRHCGAVFAQMRPLKELADLIKRAAKCALARGSKYERLSAELDERLAAPAVEPAAPAAPAAPCT